MKGTITLLKDGNPLKVANYLSLYAKNKIIAGWEKMYKPNFDKCEIKDEPEINITLKSQYKKGTLPKKVKINRVMGRKLISNSN